MRVSESISTTKKQARHIIRSFNHINLNYFFQEISLKTSILVATLIAATYIFYLFPIRFLSGHSGLFERLEPLTSLSGWWSFKNDGWHFPLFKARLLNTPEGANIAFTNSLPLMAILLKPFRYWLSKDFHYFGLWFAISYLAQAIASTFTIRSLGQRTLLAVIAAAMMSLMMPVLLWQTDNIPLVAQAYLLFGLALYFTGVQKKRNFEQISYYFTLLLSISLLTHPYLWVMTSAFYLAFLGEHWTQSSKNPHQCLLSLTTMAVCISAILVIGGYFTQKLRIQGYGHYSMNLMAPFSGGALGQRIVHGRVGQSRGFNYLGMGVSSSLLLAIVAHRRRLINHLYDHRILISILGLFTFFAISNHIFWGKQELMRYPLFFPFTLVTDVLRSSGRLFWPSGYTLMMTGLTGILRLQDKRLSILSVCFVLGLQFYDTTPLRYSLYRTVRKPASISSHWHRLVRSVSAIHLYPAYECGKHQSKNIAFWQVLAARHSKPINTAYRASKKVNCPTKHMVFKKPIRKNELYVISKDHLLPHHMAFAMDQRWCRKTEKGILCIKNTDDVWWRSRLSKADAKRNPVKKRQYDSGWPVSDWS